MAKYIEKRGVCSLHPAPRGEDLIVVKTRCTTKELPYGRQTRMVNPSGILEASQAMDIMRFECAACSSSTSESLRPRIAAALAGAVLRCA